jgi:peptidyl-prolyl cis-trans isomerase D
MLLESLRNAADKPVAKVLIGVLIFSFVGWGVASWIFGESAVEDTVLTVGGDPLKVAAFENERNRQVSAMSRDEQKQVYSDRSAATHLYEQILSKLTSEAMLEKRAGDLGLAVTTGAIAGTIHKSAEFQDNGRFSLEKFDSVLSANGMTEAYYSDAVRRTLLRNMVLSGINEAIPAPRFAILAALDARYATRKIEYVAVTYADFPVSGAPSDDHLRELYAKNPKMIPEFRDVSYVLVPVADMAEPDQYDRGYAIAQQVEDAIVSGDDLASAARKNGAKHVGLGRFSADKKQADGSGMHDILLTDRMVSDIFGMEEGTESEIVETKTGFAIFRVDHVDPRVAAPMESVRSDLVKQWRAEDQKKQAYLKANEILKAVNAKEKVVLTSASVSRVSGAPTDVLVAAFAHPVGTNTIVPGDRAFYILSVGAETLPRPDAGRMAALETEATNMLSRVLLDDYSAFLSRTYPIRVHAKTYRRLFGN